MITRFAGFVRSDRGGVGRLRVDAVRQFARCNKGISSVEMAIILPVLMLFLFGIITFASTLYVHVNMENAAREAARRIASAEVNGAGAWVPCPTPAVSPPVTAEDYACAYLFTDWPVSFEVNAGLVGVCPADRDAEVAVRVDADEVALADVFGFFAGLTLEAKVIMRGEAACPPP